MEKQYHRTVALDDLTISSSDEGRITALLGPNGSGKTTLIKILVGLVHPTAGEAFLRGVPVRDDAASVQVRRNAAYVSEDKRLYAYMTVQQILNFTRPLFPNWSIQREHALLAQFKLPPDRRFKALFKGMRTKLSLVIDLSRPRKF